MYLHLNMLDKNFEHVLIGICILHDANNLLALLYKQDWMETGKHVKCKSTTQ